jgi:hypothetical protein
MASPLPITQLVEEWLQWATWQADPENRGRLNNDLIGFDEFEWAVREHPEHAWQGILATLADARSKPYLGVLAAGPLEDLLSYHGPTFIARVESEAALNPQFAWLLGGVWQFEMTDQIWARVQAAWDRRGWDDVPIDG